MTSDLVLCTGTLKKETEKAVLILMESAYETDISLDERTIWFPKSQIPWMEISDSDQYKVSFEVKSWILDKNNIFPGE